MFLLDKIKFPFQKCFLCFYETYEYASSHLSNEAGKIIHKTGRYGPLYVKQCSYLQGMSEIWIQ